MPARELELRALLALPRLADQAGAVEQSAAGDEVRRLALAMPPAADWRVEPPAPSAAALVLSAVAEETARTICERFHYLGSHRPGGHYYGLFGPDRGTRPAAIAATTEVDVPSLEALVRPPGSRAHARVVARVFAFPGSPRNTISRLLGLVARAEAQEFASRQLLTYVNPNLGFSGTSYLASGWTLAGDEPGTRYHYVDGRYVTARDLLGRFGSSDEATLRRTLGARFAWSTMSLAPLLVFSRLLG